MRGLTFTLPRRMIKPQNLNRRRRFRD